MTTPALIVARSLIKTRALTCSISTSSIALWSCLYVNTFRMIALRMSIRNTSESCNRSCKSHNYCETENDWLLHNNIPLFVSGATFIVIIVCCLTVNVRFETEVTLSTVFLFLWFMQRFCIATAKTASSTCWWVATYRLIHEVVVVFYIVVIWTFQPNYFFDCTHSFW